MTLGFSAIATTALDGSSVGRAMDGKNARLSKRRGNLKKVTFSTVWEGLYQAFFCQLTLIYCNDRLIYHIFLL